MNRTASWKDGGAEGIRTPDPHNAIVVLYQLSYDPIRSGSETVETRPRFVKIYFGLYCILSFSTNRCPPNFDGTDLRVIWIAAPAFRPNRLGLRRGLVRRERGPVGR